MKIVEQTPSRLILRKDGEWSYVIIPGLLFVIIGLLVVYWGIGSILTGVGFITYNILFILSGLLFIIFFPFLFAGLEEEVTCSFDIIANCMILKRRSLIETKVINLPLHKISKVVVTEHTTTSSIRVSKYSTIPRSYTSYKISLVINSGKRIRLSEGIFLDANSSSHLADCIAEFLQIPLNTPF